jgi:formylglycine-generating enzyme required for sulfatase activity
MSITRSKFLELSTVGHSIEAGINFEGVTVDQLTSFLMQTCTNRLYKVDEYSIEGGRILYLASESIGEKAYYLLTAIIKENEGLTQVMLRAVSDKSHGLNGFMSEITADLRHVVNMVQSAHEIGVIRKEQVINIIDSVVQRSSFGGSGGEGAASVNIEGSVVQMTEFNAGEDRRVKEDRLRKENEHKAREEQEELRKKQEIDAKEKQKARDVQEHIAKKKSKTRTNVFMLAIVLGALLVGYWLIPPSFMSPTDYTNSIGMKFMLISAGEFDMGSSSGEEHTVKIEKAYYLSKYEVTQKQWREVMGDNPSYFEGDNRPVETVSWDDVQEFIRKLNEKEGMDKYRLPSEAEWEYACRAGTTTRYSFGEDELRLGMYAWYRENSGRETHPVGQKKPNSWGLYDMHGNVYEWVQDKAHVNYDGAPTDGRALDGGVASYEVYCGGSCDRSARFCQSTDRGGGGPGFRLDDLGFRLLQEP